MLACGWLWPCIHLALAPSCQVLGVSDWGLTALCLKLSLTLEVLHHGKKLATSKVMGHGEPELGRMQMQGKLFSPLVACLFLRSCFR